MDVPSRVSARLVAAVLGLALVLGLRAWLSHGGSFPGDRQALAHFVASGRKSDLLDLVSFFGTLGTAPVAAATVAGATVAVTLRLGPRAGLGVVLSVSVVLAVAGLKAAWGPTPLWHAIRPHHGADYPSGHTAYATSVFGYLALLAYRRGQLDLMAFAGVLIVGMGPAVILNRAHLVSDVVGGYVLGAAWLCLASLWLPAQTGAKNGVET